MAARKYYSLEKIKKVPAHWHIIYSGRAPGKSYAVKSEVLSKSWNDPENCKFIYLRRWREDLSTARVKRYFTDKKNIIKEVTEGKCDCITMYCSELFFSRTEDDGKITRIRRCGYALALSQYEHEKSGGFPDVSDIVFEEFLAKDRYLPNEPSKLFDILSTICRDEAVNVWLIGNTVSRVCPYIYDWELTGILAQPPDTIDTYHLKKEDGSTVNIAVEHTAEAEKKNPLFFGIKEKSINGSEWEVNMQPHIPFKRRECREHYSVVLSSKGFTFLMTLLSKDGCTFWYVEPKTTEIQKGSRVICDEFSAEPLYTYGFVPLSQAEFKAFELIKQKKICFSTNLCGTDFYNVIRKFSP